MKRRTSVLFLGVILVVVAITASLLIWQRSTTALPAQLSTNTPSHPALDQHERHPAGVPTDLSTPLDQHERHPAGVPTDLSTPLDQHERHPRLFGAPSGAETGTRDQWWVDGKEDDATAARDTGWLDK